MPRCAHGIEKKIVCCILRQAALIAVVDSFRRDDQRLVVARLLVHRTKQKFRARGMCTLADEKWSRGTKTDAFLNGKLKNDCLL